MGQGWTDFCESSGAASGDPFVPFDFIASFLWAPPVATQFSVVWAPPVATLVISYHRNISVGTFCGNSVFLSVIQWVVCLGTVSGNSFMSFEFKVLKILLQFGATHIKFRISSAKRRMRKKSTHKHIFIFQHCWRVSLFLGWATPSYCWALHT